MSIGIRHPFARRLNCTHAVTNYHCLGGPDGVVSEVTCAQCGKVLHRLVTTRTADELPWDRSRT